MKKKLLIVLLSIVCALCLALGLTACNKGTTSGGTSGGTEQSGTEQGSDTDSGSSSGGDTEQGDDPDEDNTGDSSTGDTGTGDTGTGDSGTSDTGSGDTDSGNTGSGEATHTHTLVKTDATDATCIEEGNIAYWYCSDCRKYFSDSNGNNEITLADTVIAKTSHTSATAVAENEVAATCTASGSYDSVVYCSVCGEEISRKTVTTPMSDHTYSGYSSNEDGHWRECTVCGNTTATENHTLENNICTVCGYEYIAVSVGLAYTLSSDETYYTVSGIGECTDTNIVIPSTYNNLPVTAIGDAAFKNQKKIISFTIPDSITSIGKSAFYNCTALKSITIPNSVKSIGDSAFNACSSLLSISLPFTGKSKTYETNSNTSLFGYIFGTSSYSGGTEIKQYYNSKSYTTFYIPEKLTTVTITGRMHNYAFYNCTTIENVIISNDTTYIGEYTFYKCTSLTGITIGNNVTSIGDCAFSNCTLLESITIPDSVTSIGNSAFSSCSKLTSITIPDSVTSIGNSAFSGCSKLTSINIPDSVPSIGSNAFYNCSKLTSVTIGNNVTSIGKDAFRYCTVLKSVYITDLEAWCNISFSNDYSNPMYLATTAKLYLNGEIISGDIVLSENVTVIPYGTFKHSKITSIEIPDSVTSIGSLAFYKCTSLENITIPDSVTSIGSYAFRDCSSLTDINVNSENTAYKSIDGNLYSYDGSTLIQYAIGKSDTSFTISNEVTSINSYAFNNCSSLTSITIPDSVTSIGSYAFYGCTALESVTIGSGVTTISEGAFLNCASITSINIPDSVTYIDNNAFSGCSKLTSVTFKNTNGWYVSTSSSTTSGTNILSSVLADTSTAATYLTSTYDNYYWYRSED